MTNPVIWFVLACAMFIAEMLTNTFYLLMVAIGFAAGGLAAVVGLGLAWQWVVGAGVGFIATALLRRSRFGKRQTQFETESNPDIMLDIGQPVTVGAWVAGSARVPYRGALWDAVAETGAGEPTGVLVIKAIRGSTLVLGLPANIENH